MYNVCMHAVYMHVRMYVCMYICMYICCKHYTVSMYVLYTFPPSLHLVSMTMSVSLCSHIILQKSVTVLGMGPCVAM